MSSCSQDSEEAYKRSTSLDNAQGLAATTCDKVAEDTAISAPSSAHTVWAELSWLDRLLAPLVVTAMILGVVIGKYSNASVLTTKAELDGVSLPIVLGMLVMMYPILTKVQYERLPSLLRLPSIWKHILLSLVLNWLIGPFVMLGLAYATLPDQAEYGTGVVLVGLARCVAMVMIWTSVAQGDLNLCALLVFVNSLLQVVLYAPMAVWFINVIGGGDMSLQYGRTAISVLIYLGIPLAAGLATRFAVLGLFGRKRLDTFLKYLGPWSLLGLLYTIIVICAMQAQMILDQIGLVFRVMVPLALYFALMWGGVMALMHWMRVRYDIATVQAFTAASNNFELAIAVSVAVYGAGSRQALAATVGPLIEVPVLLLLSYAALFSQGRWERRRLGSASTKEVEAV